MLQDEVRPRDDAGRQVRRGRRTKLSGRRLVRLLPALLIAGGLVVGVVTPAGYTAAPFFCAAPLIAASLSSLRSTAVTSLAAVLGEIWAVTYRGALEDYQESVAESVMVFVVALLALGLNRCVQRSDAHLASVRDISEAAQRAVLPTPPERLAGLGVAARYVGARADARIGGDLYAVQDTPHGVRLIVGDVRGKGLEAVEAAVIVIGAFREAAEQETTLEAVAGRLERALQREGGRRAGLDQFEGFTTAVLAEIPANGQSVLRVLNRGHPPPLLLTLDGGVRELVPAAPALPLGMGDVASWPDRSDETFFPAGALLLFFTDGVTEARDLLGRFYQPASRLRGRRFPGPDALLDMLVEDVARHTGGAPADDMALLAVQRPMSA
ncbi:MULTISPECIES: PP2C family protein-serine/threonine phosphatase [unclassified Streptomyces]|uniref:PP2C family protein-serine/threonine phosphatase n=1 Tax=unclassified Streptomyces TaxID=2593676 RepID=UPI00088C36C9|nr:MULTISPECIES: PP2C family protein-serine/threonine phosphatase [unclassified Streptomyces]PBC83336.1 serine phosphatase RsbU (regulator of sigma subunit) [Streptomyces sp. 2321.6]SDR43291.1 Serine phosphatase RsbU, regulator of sigma subunit [Streptomyces sp. KS_16]SEC92938.1 Serine phosphatase RsbU, regulator of sigma subunit [Streptomyces sp. 2133.1]SEE80523.1 Serine phosphatase RsbU, regulator of sigma subunit [Streptomyces sp. 2112.3]SNC69414.1 Serine phosphatase RsbU, regulator of sigm